MMAFGGPRADGFFPHDNMRAAPAGASGFVIGRRGFLAGTATTFATAAFSAPGAGDGMAFENGFWFDGAKFVRGHRLYAVDGRFSRARPARIARTLDLGDAYVVPPFADAHNHGFGMKTVAADRPLVARHIADGVFYTRMLGPTLMDRAWMADLGLNRVGGLDVAVADGMLTSVGGHPSALHSFLLQKQSWFPGKRPEQLDGLTYFQIASEADLDAKWRQIRAPAGSILKVVLQGSDGGRTAFGPPSRGLDPALLAAVVRKAHAEGLPVAAHIATASDFRSAVRAGVDQIAHPPTFGMIDPGDAKLAARRGVVLMSTAGNLRRLLPPQDLPEGLNRLRANYRLLREAGVPIVVGSDNIDDTSVGEVKFLHELGVFSDAELLRMWGIDTPRAIFPARRLGRFKHGYEASLLGLEGNPLQNWDATRRIRFRVKQGVVLS